MVWVSRPSGQPQGTSPLGLRAQLCAPLPAFVVFPETVWSCSRAGLEASESVSQARQSGCEWGLVCVYSLGKYFLGVSVWTVRGVPSHGPALHACPCVCWLCPLGPDKRLVGGSFYLVRSLSLQCPSTFLGLCAVTAVKVGFVGVFSPLVGDLSTCFHPATAACALQLLRSKGLLSPFQRLGFCPCLLPP